MTLEQFMTYIAVQRAKQFIEEGKVHPVYDLISRYIDAIHPDRESLLSFLEICALMAPPFHQGKPFGPEQQGYHTATYQHLYQLLRGYGQIEFTLSHAQLHSFLQTLAQDHSHDEALSRMKHWQDEQQQVTVICFIEQLEKEA